MKTLGNRLATVGIGLVAVGTVAIAPTVQPPARPAERSVQLAAATQPTSVRPPAEQSNFLGALLRLDLRQFIIPPSVGQPFPTPELPEPSPAPTDVQFEDAIINTYHAIEPWVRYGFEVATYAAGWVPYVGWLSPQIMIFYNFGERIVESLVVNSANWLWGPLPLGQGLGNIARDSWDALVRLGIDEWNFWLPPLPPPLPFGVQPTQTQAATTDTLVRRRIGHEAASLARPTYRASTRTRGTRADRAREVGLRLKKADLVHAPTDNPANAAEDPQPGADLLQIEATPRTADEQNTNPSAGTSDLYDATSDVTSPPPTPPAKPKPFGKKPKPVAEPSDPPTGPSDESVSSPNVTVKGANDSAGKPSAPKRFEATRNTD